MTDSASDKDLTMERIAQAMATLTAVACYEGFPGAIQTADPFGVLVEGKRQLAAFARWKHGKAVREP
jgi:hypothetical protein